MAYTQSDLTALQAAIAKGAHSVRMNGEEVVFRSLAEMERIEAKIKLEIGASARSRVTRISTVSQWR